MKKLIIVSLAILMLIGFSGCSSNMFMGAVQNNSSHKMSASYLYFNGTNDKELTVKDGETVTVTVKIKTTSGSIDAYIYNKDNEYSYEGHDIQTSSFTVTLSKAGDYTIKVDAQKHKGSYYFSW